MKRTENSLPLRMREIPRVQAAELRLLLFSGDENKIESIIDHLSIELFGIRPRDIRFEIPEDYWDYPDYAPERHQIEQSFNEFEDQFVTGDHLTDDETMEELLLLGVDFSDEKGQPLRCTKALGRVAEAAAKCIKGKLPDRESAALEKFEDALIHDRDNFLSEKRKSSTK